MPQTRELSAEDDNLLRNPAKCALIWSTLNASGTEPSDSIISRTARIYIFWVLRGLPLKLKWASSLSITAEYSAQLTALWAILPVVFFHILLFFDWIIEFYSTSIVFLSHVFWAFSGLPLALFNKACAQMPRKAQTQTSKHGTFAHAPVLRNPKNASFLRLNKRK